MCSERHKGVSGAECRRQRGRRVVGLILMAPAVAPVGAADSAFHSHLHARHSSPEQESNFLRYCMCSEHLRLFARIYHVGSSDQRRGSGV